MSLTNFKKHLEDKTKRKEKKRNKYNAKTVEEDGYSFRSGLERAVYNLLKTLKKCGEIKEIQVQDSVKMTDSEIDYRPDFKITSATGSIYWVEAKGKETATWRIKRKLWFCYGPGELHVYMGHYSKPFLKEVIKPKKKDGKND